MASKMHFGIDIGGNDDDGDDIGDDELEEELNALMAGKDIRKYPRAGASLPEAPTAGARRTAAPKAPPPTGRAPAPRASNVAVAPQGRAPIRRGPDVTPPRASREAVNASNEEDEESDVDEDDPELLAELSKYAPADDDDDDDNSPAPSPPSHRAPHGVSSRTFDANLAQELEKRSSGFKMSIINAQQSGDSGKVRRLERLSEQITSALNEVKAGREVNIDELPMPPPPVSPKKNVAAAPTASPNDNNRTATGHSATTVYPESPQQQHSRASSNAAAVLSKAPGGAESHRNDAAAAAAANQSSPIKSRSYAAPTTHPASLSVFIEDDHASAASKERSATVNQQHEYLTQQVQHYKLLAVQAKRAGKLDDAKYNLTKYKVLKEQLDALEGGGHAAEAPSSHKAQPVHEVHQQQPQQQPQHAQQHAQQHVPSDEPQVSAQRLHELTGAPSAAPTSIAEALKQRLAKYKESVEKANAEENTSKARRMERIVKQYEEAIRDHQRGRPVDYDALPSPPGFPPIPVPGSGVQQPTPTATVPRAAVPHTAAAAPGMHPGAAAAQPRATTSAAANASLRASNQLQLGTLVEKQKQFKLAALKAKNDGDIPLAKEYLRKAKGLEQMIAASESGLPVNLETVPAAPTNQDHYGYEVVSTATLSELRPNVKFDRTAIFKQLEVDLINQVKMCKSNSDTFSKAGDVDMAKRFQQFLKDSIHDLESLRNAFQHNIAPPKFHYETRSFNLAKTHADLPENALELHIVRAVALYAKDFEPSQMDTFVVYDFPSPSENHQTNRTPTFRSTNSPMYNSKFVIEINRRSRGTERIFKKAGIKCEIFLKCGFLRADRLLGRVFIDLSQLDTKCEMHQAFDLVDEKRKPISGKLEVKLRMREPLTGKHLEPVKETWLVIDEFAS